MNINTTISDLIGIVCGLLWIAVMIDWIWSDTPQKESTIRSGDYIDSEIEDEDKN